ncbi:uncharacterized protein LOC133179369 [Saccostrea echinata]|uniref:uncharacterized protein LOC133179369 n=1 Tax=Saccostrea echinata TaxID=191078 RepID=UPI002A8151DE|nr:uncharacterized protein LOC133179369 [Saccostrea echinata]
MSKEVYGEFNWTLNILNTQWINTLSTFEVHHSCLSERERNKHSVEEVLSWTAMKILPLVLLVPMLIHASQQQSTYNELEQNLYLMTEPLNPTHSILYLEYIEFLCTLSSNQIHLNVGFEMIPLCEQRKKSWLPLLLLLFICYKPARTTLINIIDDLLPGPVTTTPTPPIPPPVTPAG